MNIVSRIICLAVTSGICLSGVSRNNVTYRDPSADIDTRVEDLLSRMTLHEKVLQLQNRQVGEPADFDARFEGASVGTIHDMDHNTADC